MLSSTGGRPSKVYKLSSRGQELFPRHYALFSNLLINWIKQNLGEEDIVAKNCVFHKLASECDEVCLFDISLMTSLLDSKIDHKECMVKGGDACRFSTTL